MRRTLRTILFVAAAIGIGVAVGGLVGFLVAAFTAALLIRVEHLAARLDEVSRETDKARQASLWLYNRINEGTVVAPSEPPAAPDEAPPQPVPGHDAEPDPAQALQGERPLGKPSGEPEEQTPATPPPCAPPLEPLESIAPSEPPRRVPAAVAGDRARSVDEPVAAFESRPSLLQTLLATARTWLTTGNAPVKVGVLVLLVGVGLLIREASRRGIISLTIEARLIAVAVGAVLLLALGWRQRARRPIYGRSLQGAGIAALYITTYAAYEVYDLLPVAIAATAVVLVTVAAGVLAVRQDAQILAVLGIVGGFLAPVLAYRRPDDYLVVFSFYTVLSIAVVAVARFKVWPALNLVGLSFNIGISAFWLLRRFAPEDWPSLQPFIAAFVLIYLSLPLLAARRDAARVREYWTAPLVFGTPFAGLGLQQLVVGHTGRGVAASALVLAGLHVVLFAAARRRGDAAAELTDAYAGLAVVFSIIAVPLWLDAYYSTIAWAMQGLVLVWFGCRRSRLPAVVLGGLLQLLAAGAFVFHLVDALPYPPDRLVILNDYFAAAALLAAAALVSSRLLQRAGPSLPSGPTLAGPALVVGAVWWLVGGLLEIAYQAASWQLPSSFVFVVASCVVAVWVGERLGWPQLGALGLAVMPLLGFVLLAWLLHGPYHLDRPGGAAVMSAAGLCSGWLFQRCCRRRNLGPAFSWAALAWGAGWWLAGGLLEVAYRLPAWQVPMALGVVAVSFGVAAKVAKRADWPLLVEPGVLLLPAMGVLGGLWILEASHPLGRYGWAAWPVALGVHYWFLRFRDGTFGSLTATLHAGGFWVLAALLGAEVYWQVGRVAGGVWQPVATLAAVLLLAAGTLRAARESAWPVGPHRLVYLTGAIAPVLVVVAVIVFVTNLLLDGDPAPFRYIPVFNPLEMLVAPLLAVALAWRRAAAAGGDHALRRLVDRRWAPTLAPAGVAIATMSVARTIHHWRDEPWRFTELVRSTELQASLTIVWAAIALSTMVTGVRLARRAVWVAGASFMALVLLKLFLVDLANLGAVTRVVSFLGVGALLVVVGGYFAPVPPAAKDQDIAENPDPGG